MKSKIYLSKSIVNLTLNYDSEELNLKEFENCLENYLGDNKYVVALNSGTSAIHLALILSGVTKGDEVLCQSFTFAATINPVIYQGAIPVFIDSETDTWNICPKLLEIAIKDRISLGKKPKAIIVNNTYGMPAKFKSILKISKKYNIKLIEDGASSLGSSYNEKKCGNFGDFGIISFNSNKLITTLGGGILVCNSKEDKKRAIYFATQAKDKDFYYQHSKVGYNYRMSELLSKVGKEQMNFIEDIIIKRRKVNNFYKLIFKDYKGITLLEEKNKDFFSNHWLSCILIQENITGFNKEKLRYSLEKENIESRYLWKPMHLQPIYSNYSSYVNNVSESLFKNGLCLPSSSILTIDDLNRIKEVINKFL